MMMSLHVKVSVLMLLLLGMVAYAGRFEKLQKKIRALQTITFQDIQSLRESVEECSTETKNLARRFKTGMGDVSDDRPENIPPSKQEVIRLKRAFTELKTQTLSNQDSLSRSIGAVDTKITSLSNKIEDSFSELKTFILESLSATTNRKPDCKQDTAVHGETTTITPTRIRLGNKRKVGVGYGGRIEVLYDGFFLGTVCSFNFSYRSAIVACRMLGYRTGVDENGEFGKYVGPMWIRGLECTGEESDLFDCPMPKYYAVGKGRCPYTSNAAVIC